MPLEAKIIAFQEQKGTPTLWVECDPGKTTEMRKFYLIPTGLPHAIVGVGQYIGTLQDLLGLVWHCYEVKIL